MDKEKLYFAVTTKENITRLTNNWKSTQAALDTKIDEAIKAEKLCKQLTIEREKMKARIVKLKSRKGKVDQGIRACKACGKEFHEKENFKVRG